jgi:hypothetical protein
MNQAYRVDSFWEAVAIACRITGWTARLAWRWRTELLLAVPVALVYGYTLALLTEVWADMAVAALITVVLCWPRSRRLVLGRLGCARSRRLVLATLAETRTENSAGRLPRVMRSRSTPSGQRLLLRCRVGHSAELLDARVEELRAGARCRNVTITRDPNRSHRVTVHVIRRDTLTGVDITSVLLLVARRITAVHAVPAARAAEEQLEDTGPAETPADVPALTAAEPAEPSDPADLPSA